MVGIISFRELCYASNHVVDHKPIYEAPCRLALKVGGWLAGEIRLNQLVASQKAWLAS